MHGCSKLAKARAYSALVRPHLESCSPVWSPYQKGAQDALEKVQRCAARWICAKWDKANHCWDKTYEDCRSHLNWPSAAKAFSALLLSSLQDHQ